MKCSVPNITQVDLLSENIGTQCVQELFFCDRNIRRIVYSNDLFKFFGLRCTVRKKLGIYCTCDVRSVMVRELHNTQKSDMSPD